MKTFENGASKKSAEDTKTVGLRISAKQWNSLKAIAESIGMNRTELISKIAEGEIAITSQENQLAVMGKS
ncbi:MAG: hypothetical protein AAF915_18060 [Cyanobacteria bacterium P01_D01_bin.50]